MYNICIAILDHGSSRARAMGACRDRILQGGLWGRFFYPISEAEIGISYMQRGRDRTPSFLRNMV